MTELLKDSTFARMTDRSRLDRLQGEILAFVSDFEQEGYSNMEIARQLIGAAFLRARRERVLILDGFHRHVRDASDAYLTAAKDLNHRCTTIQESIKRGH